MNTARNIESKREHLYDIIIVTPMTRLVEEGDTDKFPFYQPRAVSSLYNRRSENRRDQQQASIFLQ